MLGIGNNAQVSKPLWLILFQESAIDIGFAPEYLKITPIKLKAIIANIPGRKIPFAEITMLSLTRMKEDMDTYHCNAGR